MDFQAQPANWNLYVGFSEDQTGAVGLTRACFPSGVQAGGQQTGTDSQVKSAFAAAEGDSVFP